MPQPSPWNSGNLCSIFCWYGCRKDGCCSKNEYHHSNEYHHEWWCYISPPLPHVIVSSLAGDFNKAYFWFRFFSWMFWGPAKAASLAVFFGGSRGLEPYIRSQELYIYIYLKSSPPTNPRLVSAKPSSRWWQLKYLLFSPRKFGEDSQFDGSHIFQMALVRNHHPSLFFTHQQATLQAVESGEIVAYEVAWCFDRSTVGGTWK